MRDEMDARIWVANHSGFADGIDELVGKVRSVIVRIGSWDGSTAHLAALVAAFLVTALTFSSTSA